jgi:diacylglycerol kinase
VRKPFSVTARVRSFGYALAGLLTLLREQHNARIHLLATVLVIALAAYLQVSRLEWSVLLLCIALVWMAEALNSALEYFCDAVIEEEHPLIAKAKDVAAAGVLICAVVAAVVGCLVLVPYL